MAKITLRLDLGEGKKKGRRHWRAHPEQRLAAFLRVFPARAAAALPIGYFERKLEAFMLQPVTLNPGEGVWVVAGEANDGSDELKEKSHVPVEPEKLSGGALTGLFDTYYEEEMAREQASGVAPVVYPDEIGDRDAVKMAYGETLKEVAGFLEHGLSVLIRCDKILTEYIFEYVCKRAGKRAVLDNATSDQGQSNGQASSGTLQQAVQDQRGGLETQLPRLIRHLKEDELLVLRSVDMLDNPMLIEVIYQSDSLGKKPQLLGFLDPSLEIKKVLSDRFAVHVQIMELPRYLSEQDKSHMVTRLITRREHECFDRFDAEGLYKNVSGLNAIQFRNAMRYVAATVAKGEEAGAIYQLIRKFKTSSSSEIEIPDTKFEQIGGYEQVKEQLRHIIALVAGQVSGMKEAQRKQLIPRGLIFHGPPGTGKTLFAKAIANEMNATIQMVSGPEIMDKYVGQSESNLRHIFTTARRNAPSVIFFDEFDSIAAQRSTYSDGGARANNAVVAQLLTELDGFRGEQAVLLIGTTNRIDIIDEALLRPSRLRPIEIGLPDQAARRGVAQIHAENFGIDQLLHDLCELILAYLADWQRVHRKKIPNQMLNQLFAAHPRYRSRYHQSNSRARFVSELQELFALVQKAKQPAPDGDQEKHQDKDQDQENNDYSALKLIREQLITIGKKYECNLEDPSASQKSQLPLSMEEELAKLFYLVQGECQEDDQNQPSYAFSPKRFVSNTLDLVAQYTEDFNNDEIRAIFQDASLEYHLEGALISPRYLGRKIGLVRKRRDQREKVHLSRRGGW